MEEKHFRPSLAILYQKYKDTPQFSIAVSGMLLFVCFFMLVRVILPQIESLNATNRQVVETRSKISILTDNIRIINSYDSGKVTTDAQTAITALPSDQDFMGILQAVSSAASNAGISLEDYSFSLGNLSNAAKGAKLVPVSMKVGAKGSIEAVKNFIHELNTKLPVATITSIDGSSQTIDVLITFYSKSLPKVALSEDTVTKPLSDNSEKYSELLSTLTDWQNSLQVVPEFTESVSSASSLIAPF